VTTEILYAIVALTSLGLVAAVVIYFVSAKFYVKEDPRIKLVEEVLPATNCGGCGQPGCHAFALAVVQAGDLSKLHCPVGGNAVMKQVAEILGVKAVEKDPYVAIVRCSGSFEHRKKTNIYAGEKLCKVAANLYSGDTGCAYGCLGFGDCVEVCDFEAMYMDARTGLPVVIENKCTACNACVKECPKHILELWPQGKKNQRIYVACINEEEGSEARKACAVACDGCAKCFDICKYDAIQMKNDLAYIDPEKCKLCLQCIDVCEVHNIIAANVSPDKIKAVTQARLKLEEKERLKMEESKLRINENGQVV
jgi:Na+-translocating ferredoxin:NAD+ oxidoreductase subunit B